MIKEFRLVSLTKEGDRALQNNIDEYKKLPIHAKAMWNGLFSRRVEYNPFTLIIGIKNNPLNTMVDSKDFSKDFTKKLIKAMTTEGVKHRVDFKIMVIEK